MSCREGHENTCNCYPACYGCDMWARTHYGNYYKSKESKSNMDLSNVSINIGNKTYEATTIDWMQTPGEYPEVRARVSLNPNNILKHTTTTPTPTITNVIFNPPATIVFWSDRTKTVVKCDYEYETYDPEKGLAMAIAKKMIGDNKREYYHTFLHWLKKWDKQPDVEEYTATFTCAPGEVFLNGNVFSSPGTFTFTINGDTED